MGFLDRKETVVKFLLTEHGRKLLAKGELAAKYYSFGDQEVDYQTEFTTYETSSIPSDVATSSWSLSGTEGMTVWFRADVGLTSSGGKVTSILNLAPSKFKVFQTVASAQPITSSQFSSVTPIVPYFSGNGSNAVYFVDDSSGGNTNLNITSALSPREFHFFAVFKNQFTGTFNSNPQNAYGLAGDVGSQASLMTFESTGSRMYLHDGVARTSAWLPYSSGNLYVAEGFLSSTLTMSLALNGGIPITGTITGNMVAAGIFSIGAPRTAASSTSHIHLAEFLVFSKSLNSATASLVRNELGARWGINVNPSDVYAIGRFSNTALFQGPAAGAPDFTNGTGSFGIVARKTSVESSNMVREYRFHRFSTGVSGFRTMIYDGTSNNRIQVQLVNALLTNSFDVNTNFLQNSQLYSFGFCASGSTLATYLSGQMSSAPTALDGYTPATLPFSVGECSSIVIDEFELVSLSFSPLALSSSQWSDWNLNCISASMSGTGKNRRLPGATYHWEASDWDTTSAASASWTDQISAYSLALTGALVKRNIRGAEWPKY